MKLDQETWQSAFGQPTPSFDARIRHTLDHLEEEKKMKKFALRTVVIALALLLAATGAVYAATAGWNIGDYFENMYGSNVNLPRNFISGFDQTLTQQVGDVVFTVRDAYVDDENLHTVITVARADGKPAIFLMTDLEEEDPAYLLIPGIQEEDKRTIAQYAAEHDLPIYYVNTWFTQGEERPDGAMDVWMEEDGTTAAYVGAMGVQTEDNAAHVNWNVLARQEEDSARDAMDITLSVEPMERWEIAVNQPVEGLPLTVDTLYLREGRLGLHVDIAFSIDTANATEEQIQQIREGIWFEIIDPATGERLPGGATTSGVIEPVNDEETAFLQKGNSLSSDFSGDTLTLRAYDAWERVRFGTVDVKIK